MVSSSDVESPEPGGCERIALWFRMVLEKTVMAEPRGGWRGYWARVTAVLLLSACACLADAWELAREAARAGDYEKAVPLLVEALRSGQENGWAVQNDLALASYLAGNSLDAAMALETMHLRDPLSVEHLEVLSECYARLSTNANLQAVFRERARTICDVVLTLRPPASVAESTVKRKMKLSQDAEAAENIEFEENAAAEAVPELPGEPPERLYAGILREFDSGWLSKVAASSLGGVFDAREVALLADPAIVRHKASAGGVVGHDDRVTLRLFPTYPAAAKYLPELKKRLGTPDREEQQGNGKYTFTFYGNCILISDKDGNVWGLIQSACK
jgi:hypothetical protein